MEPVCLAGYNPHELHLKCVRRGVMTRMSDIPRHRLLAHAVMGVALASVVAGCQGGESALAPAATDAVAESLDPRAAFVGTWTLARVERYDQTGAPLPDFVHAAIGHGNQLGYLMSDGERMGIVVQQEGRVRSAGIEPTPEEALAAVESYTAYFGPFSVNVADGYVSHQITVSLNPRRTGGETLPFYEFSANQLVLTPGLQCPDSFLTNRGCGYGTTGIQLRNVWEWLEPSTAAGDDARFLGFWEIDRIERQTLDGSTVPTTQYAEGYLIYMPSGYMAVHLMRPDRVPYEGLRPTAAEADAAMRSYVSYFGPFSVHAAEGVVVHRRAGHLNPNDVGVNARRAFEFRDGQLILKPPVSTVDGQEMQTLVFWNRLSTFDPDGVASGP